MPKPTLFGIATALLTTACATASAATVLDGDGEKQAKSLTSIYATFCVKHITELKKLSDQMALSPRLAPEKAAFFLQGSPGSAWLVPDPVGVFVVAIRSDKPMCAVYAKRADQGASEKLFQAIATAATSSLSVKKVEDAKSSFAKGQAHTLTYEWKASAQKNKLVFSLTTTDSDAVPMQAVATAVVVPQ